MSILQTFGIAPAQEVLKASWHKNKKGSLLNDSAKIKSGWYVQNKSKIQGRKGYVIKIVQQEASKGLVFLDTDYVYKQDQSLFLH